LVLDLNGPDADIRRAGEEALKVYGHIDVLVNNAGYGVASPVEEIEYVQFLFIRLDVTYAQHSLDQLREQFQTNVFGAIALTQAVLPSFRARKSGHILNISSVAAFIGIPSFGAYSATKAALELLTEALSQEVAPYNIRVQLIEPGYFSTNFMQATAAIAEGKRSTIYTDPSQGYGMDAMMIKTHLDKGQIGDVVKLSERLYEVVHGTGLAKGLIDGQGEKREWLRVPLGPDAGELTLGKIDQLRENVKALEPIWRSTDVDPERLKFFPRG